MTVDFYVTIIEKREKIRGKPMKKYMTAYAMTQSMFCSLPFPCKAWDEKCRPYMLLFLPVIGLEIGVLWVAMSFILRYFQVPAMIYGLVMCALPYLLTGFMHLDGYMDVVDAVCSWRDLKRRREILKDSHVGSFAVVWCVFLILAGFAVFSSMSTENAYGILLLIPVVSRCCSAMAIMSLKTMNTSQYAGSVNYPKGHKAVVTLMVLICMCVGVAVWGKYSLALLGCLAGYAVALRKSYKSLQGMNGDISGFCICISELCAVAVLVIL